MLTLFSPIVPAGATEMNVMTALITRRTGAPFRAS